MSRVARQLPFRAQKPLPVQIATKCSWNHELTDTNYFYYTKSNDFYVNAHFYPANRNFKRALLEKHPLVARPPFEMAVCRNVSRRVKAIKNYETTIKSFIVLWLFHSVCVRKFPNSSFVFHSSVINFHEISWRRVLRNQGRLSVAANLCVKMRFVMIRGKFGSQCEKFTPKSGRRRGWHGNDVA